MRIAPSVKRWLKLGIHLRMKPFLRVAWFSHLQSPPEKYQSYRTMLQLVDWDANDI